MVYGDRCAGRAPAVGPAPTRTPHVLDDVWVFDPDGGQVRLGTLWEHRAVVLAFVRHFGCLFCTQQVMDIAAYLDRIRAAGGELFVIGHGTVEQARAFRDERRLTFPVLTDPDRQAYRALEMRRGPRTILKPSVIAKALAALKAGFRQTRVAGDPLQVGGVVIIGHDGVERYRYLSRFAGDHPDTTALVRLVVSGW